MNRVRYQLLARARLAGYKHGCVRRRDALYESHDFAHGFRDRNDFWHRGLARKLLSEPLIINTKPTLFGGLLDQSIEFRDAIGLRQVIVCAELHGLYGRLDRGVAREHD